MDVKKRRSRCSTKAALLLEAVQEAVQARNKLATHDPETGKQIAPEYRVEAVTGEPVTDELRLNLSDRVRRGELYAFVEIPANVLESPTDGKPTMVSFYAENTTLSDEKRWFEAMFSELVQSRRLRTAGIDPAVVAQSRAIAIEGRGLFQRDAGGSIKKAKGNQESAVDLSADGRHDVHVHDHHDVSPTDARERAGRKDQSDC